MRRFFKVCSVCVRLILGFVWFTIDLKWLKYFLISFTDHGGFHEQCIELIFTELKNKFHINHLEVCGRFQRRGGIDINPIRGTHKKKLFANFREFNQ